MTTTLEAPATEVRPDQPPLPAEAATDVPSAAVLGDPTEIHDSTTEVAEPAPSKASGIDTLASSSGTSSASGFASPATSPAACGTG